MNLTLYTIIEHLPLDTASKDICYDTKLPYTGQADEISEWAMAMAISTFPIGSQITEQDLHQAIIKAVTDQTLSSLVDKGIVDPIWDPKTNDFAFKLSNNEGNKS